MKSTVDETHKYTVKRSFTVKRCYVNIQIKIIN